MLEVTTSSPKRPNFFWYCFLTVFRNSVLLEKRGDPEKSAQEGVALHAQLQVAAGGRLPGNVETGQNVHTNVVVADIIPVLQRNAAPGGLGRIAGFPNQAAAFLDAFQRVGVGKSLG